MSLLVHIVHAGGRGGKQKALGMYGCNECIVPAVVTDFHHGLPDFHLLVASPRTSDPPVGGRTSTCWGARKVAIDYSELGGKLFEVSRAHYQE